MEDKVDKAKERGFERHLILLETGSEMSSNCRTHFISKKTYELIPESLKEKCRIQSNNSSKYCTLYSLDGVTKKIQYLLIVDNIVNMYFHT